MSPVYLSLWLATQFVAMAPPSEWNSDYAQAVRVARAQRRPLVVVLEDRSRRQKTASVLDNTLVKMTLRDCSVCRLDIRTRDGAEVANQLNAKDFPYTVVSDRTGRHIVLRGAGEFSESTWLRLLDDVIDTNWDKTRAVASYTNRAEFFADMKPTREQPDDENSGDADSAKLRVVVVSSNGCAYCEKLKIETLPDPSVGQVLEDDMSLEYVNASDDDSLARQHDVTVYPSILVLREDDELVDRIDGFVGPGELVNRLKACESQH